MQGARVLCEVACRSLPVLWLLLLTAALYNTLLRLHVLHPCTVQVPVEAGSYKVRVRAQPGWVFSPQEVQISCSSQACNSGEDVNFELTGFELSGHVEAAAAAASCKAAPGGV